MKIKSHVFNTVYLFQHLLREFKIFFYIFFTKPFTVQGLKKINSMRFFFVFYINRSIKNESTNNLIN